MYLRKIVNTNSNGLFTWHIFFKNYSSNIASLKIKFKTIVRIKK